MRGPASVQALRLLKMIELVEVHGDGNGACSERSAEARHKRRPTRQETREAPEILAQVDVLAASLRSPRGELGVGERTGKGERATDRRDRQGRHLARQHRGDDAWRGEDADADDVGDHDRRCIQRSQLAIKGGGTGRRHEGVLVSSRRVTGYLARLFHCVEPYFASSSTSASMKCVLLSISSRD